MLITPRFVDAVPGSDEWWLDRLRQQLAARIDGTDGSADGHPQGGSSFAGGSPSGPYSLDRLSNSADSRPGLRLLWDWFRGEALPPGASEEWAAGWAHFLRRSRLNMAETVVSSVSDRLVPSGWQTAAEDDPDGDQVAEEIARETNLVLATGDAIEDMLWSSRGYLLVSATGEEGSARPLITPESPMSTIVAHDTASRAPRAGLRRVVDEWTGDDEYWLYKPGYIRVLPADSGVLGERQVLPVEGMFPLIELRNRRGVGEFERHLDSLVRINDSIFSRIVLTKLQAHRQRAIQKDKEFLASGDDVQIDTRDMVTGPDALWDLPPGVSIWESSAADLTQVRMMVQDDIKLLCSATGTPLSDAVPDAANQSARGSKIVEDKYIFRIEDRKRRADNGIARALSLCFQIVGDVERGSDVHKIRTIWDPVDRYSLQERSQAATVLQNIMPLDWIATNVLQIRPADLPGVNAARARDMIYRGASNAATPAPQQDS